MHSIASRRLRPQVPFTSRGTQLGLAPSFAANHPRELPRPLDLRPTIAPRLLKAIIWAGFMLLFLAGLFILYLLLGQQWRSGADPEPEAHEAAAPSRPYEWANETE